MKNTTIYLIVIGFLIVMLLPNLRGCKKIETVDLKNDTTLISSTLKVTIDSNAYARFVIEQYLKTHKTRSVYSPKKPTNTTDTVTILSNLCDTINTYLDTLKENNIEVYNEFQVRGELLSHKSSAKYTELHINTDSVRTDSVLVREPYPVEVPKITTKQRINHLSIGALIGAIVILFAIK